MRRLLLLVGTPFLVSAASPLALAEQEAREALAEQARLEQAATTARNEAERAARQAAAAAHALVAAEAGLAAGEERLRLLERRKAVLERRLAEARRPATALLAGLAEAGRRPAWLALAGADKVEEQVRLAALLRHVRPEIERRTANLRGEWQGLAAISREQRRLQEELGRQRTTAVAARARFAALERTSLAAAEARGVEAAGAGDRVISRGERLAELGAASQQRRAAARLASELARLAPSEERPVAPESAPAAAHFAWRIPASGAVAVGLGELLPNGVRARGLTIAAARGTQVVAPAPGRVVFAGPFRRREGVVILDHGGGWLTLLSEVRPSVRVGDEVEAGALIGRAMGEVTAELFRDGKAEPAALIAGSS